MEKPINLIEKGYSESLVLRMNNWLESNSHIMTNKNDVFKLKVGDTIVFKNGYGIPLVSKIIGFNIETGHAYIYWDSYWGPIDISERLIKYKDKIEITEKILKLNEKANKIGSLKNEILENIDRLNKDKSLLFGYRASCGVTDPTMKTARIWALAIKEFEKQGVYLRQEHSIVGNSYATLKGGFWNETRYFF